MGALRSAACGPVAPLRRLRADLLALSGGAAREAKDFSLPGPSPSKLFGLNIRRPVLRFGAGSLWLVLALSGCLQAPILTPPTPPPIAVLGPAPGPARAERVVVISVDGLRPEALEASGAKTFQDLIAKGAWAEHMETVRPSITLPSHTAMLTGLDFGHHPVVWNNYRAGFIPAPTIFSVVSQSKKASAMLFSKDKFHYLANPACVSFVYGPPVPNKLPEVEDYSDPAMREKLLKRDELFEKRPIPTRDPVPLPGELMTSADMLERAFREVWPRLKVSLTFIHFREPDEYGHRYGWMSAKYLKGVKDVDMALSGVLEVIEKNGGWGKVALIVTADHGGSGRGHYKPLEPDRPENVRIPWICVGPGVPAGLRIARPLRTFDTAPTALAFLGLGAPEGIDGHAILEVLP